MSTRDLEPPNLKDWISIRETAALLGVTRQRVLGLDESLQPLIIELGRGVRHCRIYLRSTVEAFSLARAELARVRAVAASARRDIRLLAGRKPRKATTKRASMVAK